MKNHLWKLAGLLSCMSFVFLVSCAADPNNCQSGYVYGGTQYGCQPQGSCPSGEFQISGAGSCLTASNTAALSTASCAMYSGYTLNSQYNVCCPANVAYNPAYGNSQGCQAASATGTTGTCTAGCSYYNGACYTTAGQYCGASTSTGAYSTGQPTPSGACPQNPTAGCYYYASQAGYPNLNHCYTTQGQYCGM